VSARYSAQRREFTEGDAFNFQATLQYYPASRGQPHCHAHLVGFGLIRSNQRVARPPLSDRVCHASCIRHGQGELESGARADIARSPYPSPVSFDDRTADGKPHAHAAGLGGVERVEQTVKTVYV
jgi:hypothetical protein